MTQPDEVLTDTELQKKAAKTQRTIYIVMFVLMALPFVAAWLTGAIRF